VLLGITAVLYLWGLSASGWANSYYSAAVQAGTRSWKAFFFGSLDAANFITVDKSPVFLWPMEVSARVFGLSSWSILVPQALEGVATVGLLYATVRRWFGPPSALLAGAIVALTPVAGLIFRYNNPDALLLLLLTASAYALTRALENGSGRWLTIAFALIGFGFLAKMLQTLMVVPPFAFVYLTAAPPTLARRLRQLLVAGLAMLVSAGWWIAAVQLTPGADRPYIGGSQNNSLWNLIFGYNGFGRLTGNEAGSVGGGARAGSRWGPTGLTRLFNASFGGQISWLLPAAGILLCAGLATTWRRSRTDRTRSALVLWGGWLFVTGTAFSLGQGIIHPYYTVALAPAIGAVVSIGAVALWRQRSRAAWYGLVAAFVATVVWSDHLLARTPTWHPWLRTVLVVGGVAVSGALLVWPFIARRPSRLVVAVAVVLALLGPGTYTLATATTPHSGAIPSAGPATAGAGPGGPPPTGGRGSGPGGTAGANRALGGGLLDGTSVSSQLRSYLTAQHSTTAWLAATVDANNAASYQLATGEPVMAIGGFNGTDPAPTLAQFERDVAAHKVDFFLAAGGSGFGSGPAGPGPTTSTAADQISAWVAAHFSAQVVAGVTLYRLR
jgi:4-amino-4-deoxy-L-arabinose transferase-like glycosyltransferase